nr:hypothetical protein [Tanacetum cinerariifolium]
ECPYHKQHPHGFSPPSNYQIPRFAFTNFDKTLALLLLCSSWLFN